MNNVAIKEKTKEQIQEEIILQQSKIIKDLLKKCEELGGDRGLYENLINRRPIRMVLFCYKICKKFGLTKPLRAMYAFCLFIKRS